MSGHMSHYSQTVMPLHGSNKFSLRWREEQEYTQELNSSYEKRSAVIAETSGPAQNQSVTEWHLNTIRHLGDCEQKSSESLTHK